jgi:hypothetical protein
MATRSEYFYTVKNRVLRFPILSFKTCQMNVRKILLLLVAAWATQAIAQPTAPAPVPPARPAANVISIYSGAYTNVANTNFNPNWGQSGFGTATTLTLAGDEMRDYPNWNYQGVAFGSFQNVSSLDTVSFDFWSPTTTSIEITLVTEGFGERAITRPLTLNTWNTVRIPLSAYAALGIPLTAIKEFKFVTLNPASNGRVFIDNMYFFTNATLPTLSNFSVAPRMLGDAPFTLTPPTSNSSGAFTYTSSNTNVATISGNTVTILAGGTSTITAIQAASGSFASASITAVLTVNVPPLSTNAPNPTKPALNVISLFSNSYTNRPVSDWRTSWSGAGPLIDTAISGNDIKKYTAVDYVGIEFPPIDATLADTFHVSMWTPSAQTFGVKLVNQGGGPTNENIAWFTSRPEDANLSSKYGPRPNQGQWNNYSIPLSHFATNHGGLILTTRNAIFQMLFVGTAPFSDNVYYVDNIYFSSSSFALPASFASFEVSKANGAAQLNWNIATEQGVQQYIVEKSTTGASFKAIGSVNARGATNYSFTDNNMSEGISYYRIKAVGNDGSFKYSAIRMLNVNAGNVEFAIFPNPAKNELIVKNLVGTNSISLINAAGNVVLNRANVTSAVTSIQLNALPNGVYTVMVTNGTESKSTRLLIDK